MPYCIFSARNEKKRTLHSSLPNLPPKSTKLTIAFYVNIMFALSSKLLIAATLVATASAQWNWQDGSGGLIRYANGCDMQGNDLYSVNTVPQRCGDLCVNDPRCTHYVWEPQNGCWLKGGNGAAVIENSRTQCGYIRKCIGLVA